MERLIRHIEAARRDAEEFHAAGSYALARVRRRDEAFLRRVMLGFETAKELKL